MTYFWKRFGPALSLVAVVAIIGACARFAIGNIYSEAEATSLIKALTNAGLYLGSAIATSAATTLALMLTLIGLIKRSDNEFGEVVFQRISVVATFATATLIGAVIFLMFLVFPVGEFEKMPDDWYVIAYDVLFAMMVGICGLIVGTVFQLYLTVRHVIADVTPGDGV